MTTFFTPLGDADKGVITLDATGKITSVDPLNTLQVVGNDGSGNIAPVTLSAGTGMQIYQNGDAVVFSSNSGSGASVGLGSPYTLAFGSIGADFTLTTQGSVNATPNRSNLQLVYSTTITPDLGNTNGVGSQVAIIATIPFYGINTNAIGIQAAIFIGSSSSPLCYNFKENGAMPGSPINQRCLQLSGLIPSQGAQVPIEVSIYAAYTQAVPSTIKAAGFYLVAYEIVPNTQGIIGTTTTAVIGAGGPTISAPWTSTGASLSNTTQILAPTNVNRSATNSLMVIYGEVSLRNYNAPLADYYTGIYLYFSSASTINSTGNILYLDCGASGEASMLVNNSGFTTAAINIVIPVGQMTGAGTYSVALGATYQGATKPQGIGVGGKLTINEILPLSTGGNIQTYALPGVSATASIVSTTLSPQYGDTFQVTSSDIVLPRSSSSYLLFSGTCSLRTSAGGPESQVLFCFYNSNLATALPIFTVPVSCAACTNTNINSGNADPFFYILPSPGLQEQTELYVGIVSTTPGNTSSLSTISWGLQEVLVGSAATGLVTASTTPPSYIEAVVTAGNLNLENTLATNAQAGLLSVDAPLSSNSVVRVLNSGDLAATSVSCTFPAWYQDVSLQFGGAAVGQSISCIALAQYESTVPTPASAFSSGAATTLVYPVRIKIFANVASKGTSTGTATLVGIPVVPANLIVGVHPVPFHSTNMGLAPAGNSYICGYSGTSAVLTFYQIANGSGSYTPITDAAFPSTAFNLFFDFTVWTEIPPTT